MFLKNKIWCIKWDVIFVDVVEEKGILVLLSYVIYESNYFNC